MTRTSWFRKNLPAGTATAVPLYKDGNGHQDIGHYCFIKFASGQLYSSANDMAKFLKSMLEQGVDDLWSNAIGEQLFSCQEEFAPGQKIDDCTTGIGWDLINNSKKQSLSNGNKWLENFKQYDWTGGAMINGGEYGITSQILVSPTSKVYIAVMTNTHEAPAEEIASFVGQAAGQEEEEEAVSVTDINRSLFDIISHASFYCLLSFCSRLHQFFYVSPVVLLFKSRIKVSFAWTNWQSATRLFPKMVLTRRCTALRIWIVILARLTFSKSKR